MKKIILATILAGIGSTAALAADMGARTPYTKAPVMMAPVASWSGFYIGGNIGYGWGNGNTDFGSTVDPVAFGIANTSLNSKSRGVIGGAQLGYNWQMGSLLVGLETDIQGADVKSSAKGGPFVNTLAGAIVPGSFRSADQKLSWFGTARGRLGSTITTDLLLYATGGIAYGQSDGSGQLFASVTAQFPASISKVSVGWTAGAGAEWMFAHQWSAKVEYLYLDLGNVSVISNNPLTAGVGAQVKYDWKNQDHIVRAGVNYHF